MSCRSTESLPGAGFFAACGAVAAAASTGGIGISGGSAGGGAQKGTRGGGERGESVGGERKKARRHRRNLGGMRRECSLAMRAPTDGFNHRLCHRQDERGKVQKT